jgi:hypothetical protein
VQANLWFTATQLRSIKNVLYDRTESIIASSSPRTILLSRQRCGRDILRITTHWNCLFPGLIVWSANFRTLQLSFYCTHLHYHLMEGHGSTIPAAMLRRHLLLLRTSEKARVGGITKNNARNAGRSLLCLKHTRLMHLTSIQSHNMS